MVAAVAGALGALIAARLRKPRTELATRHRLGQEIGRDVATFSRQMPLIHMNISWPLAVIGACAYHVHIMFLIQLMLIFSTKKMSSLERGGWVRNKWPHKGRGQQFRANSLHGTPVTFPELLHAFSPSCEECVNKQAMLTVWGSTWLRRPQPY